MAATTADLVNRFIELSELRKTKEGEVDEIKDELALLEPQILERFENAGMQSMKSTQGQVVYVRRELWAGAQEGCDELLADALKRNGLGDLVRERINTQTLSSYVREVEKAQFNGSVRRPDEILPLLPDGLQQTIKLSEKFSVRARK